MKKTSSKSRRRSHQNRGVAADLDFLKIYLYFYSFLFFCSFFLSSLILSASTFLSSFLYLVMGIVYCLRLPL